MCYRVCSDEQFIKQRVKNKTIFSKKWVSTGCLDAHLAKSLLSSELMVNSAR